MPQTRNELHIIVPVYKNKDLVESCLNSIDSAIKLYPNSKISVSIINDSPGDSEVTNYLNSVNLGDIELRLIHNSKNLGFVRSCNKGLKLARDKNAHALLLNSDTIIYDDAIETMVDAIESDPWLGFVGPRSNNAGLASLPKLQPKPASLADKAYADWKSIKGYLPEKSFPPTLTGFCLLIRNRVLHDVGLLDEEYGHGYEEENDYVIRGSRLGWRPAIINSAFVYHKEGSSSFTALSGDAESRKQHNLKIINRRYPEFLPQVRWYEASPEYVAEKKMSGLCVSPGSKFRLCLDMSMVTPIYNGTNVLAINALKALSAAPPCEFSLVCVMPETSRRFHEIDNLANVTFTSKIERYQYSCVVSFGQPFTVEKFDSLHHCAPVVIWGAYDTIALDCINLSHEHGNLRQLWPIAYQYSNGLFFISESAIEMFESRFHIRRPADEIHTAFLPIPPLESRPILEKRHILVMGNKFAHKNSLSTAKTIANAFPHARVVCLGGEEGEHENVLYLQSGTVAQAEMQTLMGEASIVVLPSLSEGYGFGLVEALAKQLVVVAKDIPATREILDKVSPVQGVHLYQSDSELIQAIINASKDEKSSYCSSDGDWVTWASELTRFALKCIRNEKVFELAVNREREIERLRLIEYIQRHEAREHRSTELTDKNFELELNSMFLRYLGRPVDRASAQHYTKAKKLGVPKWFIRKRIATSREALDFKALNML